MNYFSLKRYPIYIRTMVFAVIIAQHLILLTRLYEWHRVCMVVKCRMFTDRLVSGGTEITTLLFNIQELCFTPVMMSVVNKSRFIWDDSFAMINAFYCS